MNDDTMPCKPMRMWILPIRSLMPSACRPAASPLTETRARGPKSPFQG